MSDELAYSISQQGDVTFSSSGHLYRVVRFPRGNPAITIFNEWGSQLAVDRLDPFEARARSRFARLVDDADDHRVIEQELSVLATLMANEPKTAPTSGESDDILPYAEVDGGLVWRKPVSGGSIDIPLTNFTARIRADLVRDDGVETQRVFEIEARLGRRVRTFSVPADRFHAMNWPTMELGAQALLYPGVATRDHSRTAVQILSGEIPERHVYAHLGWREVEGNWVFLHAGGALGASGVVPGVEVDLPDALSRYLLPTTPTGDELVRAIQASLGMLDMMPDEVTFPAYAVVWRAVIGEADFSIHAEGSTGEGKTELLALVLQHFGAGLDARHIPGSWSSTGNALEGMAFLAKDSAFGIDDYVVAGGQNDAARLNRDADRVFRAQGNGSSRHRLRSGPNGLTLQPPKPPRGIVFSTGEDIPRGQSLRGRVAILSVNRGSCQWKTLSVCQRDAANGLYAQALAAFICWLAADRAGHLTEFRACVQRHRATAIRTAGHRRTPGVIANMMAALDLFREFAVGVGALTTLESSALETRCWRALGIMAANQPGFQQESEPTRLFRSLLASAIASGEAHLADDRGGTPLTPAARGWRLATVGSGDFEREEWRPQGKRVGWAVGNGQVESLYLDPASSLAVAQELGRRGGDALTVTSGVLRKRLHEYGLLVASDSARETLTVRRMLEEAQRSVLHVVPDFLDPQGTEKPDISDSGESDNATHAGSMGADHHSDRESSDSNVGNVGFSQPPHPTDQRPPEPEDGPSVQTSFASTCMSCGGILRPGRTFYCHPCEMRIWGKG